MSASSRAVAADGEDRSLREVRSGLGRHGTGDAGGQEATGDAIGAADDVAAAIARATAGFAKPTARGCSSGKLIGASGDTKPLLVKSRSMTGVSSSLMRGTASSTSRLRLNASLALEDEGGGELSAPRTGRRSGKKAYNTTRWFFNACIFLFLFYHVAPIYLLCELYNFFFFAFVAPRPCICCLQQWSTSTVAVLSRRHGMISALRRFFF